MTSQLILLGSGGWIPTSRRETCCAYLRHGPRVLLIDAGTGVQRLVEQSALLDGVDRIDIVLTHFHLDHVAGLSYLPALSPEVHVWGPGKRLYGTPTADILGRLLGSPLFAPLGEIVAGVHDIPEGRYDVGGLELSTRGQELHSDPTLALRVGDDFTYCTDTAADEHNAEFAAGSRLMLHEAWHASATTDDSIHTAAGEAGRIARAAGVERLVLIHVNPLLARDEPLADAARAQFEPSSVGQDLVPIESGSKDSRPPGVDI